MPLDVYTERMGLIDEYIANCLRMIGLSDCTGSIDD